MTDQDSARKEAEALVRAMSFTRLVDGGMDSGDARALHARSLAGESWTAVAEDLGDRRLADAAAAGSAGHLISQRKYLLWAAAAFNFGQVAVNSDTDEKRRLYGRFDRTLDAVAAVDPSLTRVEVDAPKGTQYGWLVTPDGPAAGAVVTWGGLSGWGATYLGLARQLAKRGIACLLAEGPGQGRTRLDSGIHLDGRFVDGFAAFVTTANQRLGDVPVGAMGNSFGALYAARLAAADDRLAACVINGAPATPAVPEFRTAREQILAAMGLNSVPEAEEVVTTLAFDPAEHRIGCPTLVLHGGADVLVPRAAIDPFLDGADGPVQLRIWDDGEHTIYNHAVERDLIVADWFLGALTGAVRPAR